MSVDVLLQAEGLTDASVIRLVEFSSGSGTWPLYGWTTDASRTSAAADSDPAGPEIGIAEHDDGQRLFVRGVSDGPGDIWVVASAARSRFRATLNLLADELPDGFSVRATRIGTAVEREEVLSAAELATLAEGDGLEAETLYVVRPRFT